jgi:hypothetical protein
MLFAEGGRRGGGGGSRIEPELLSKLIMKISKIKCERMRGRII